MTVVNLLSFEASPAAAEVGHGARGVMVLDLIPALTAPRPKLPLPLCDMGDG